MSKSFESVQEVRDGLKKVNYLADDGIASVVYLAQRLGKLILGEGPAGTAKTKLATSVSDMLNARLNRLQIDQVLDGDKALYDY